MTTETEGLPAIGGVAQTLFRNRVVTGASELLELAQSVQSEGISQEHGEQIINLIDSTLKGVPNRGELIAVRKSFREIQSHASDLCYAASNDLIDNPTLHTEIEKLLSRSQLLVETCSVLPEDAAAPTQRGGTSLEELSQADVSVGTAASDVTLEQKQQQIDAYYRKASKVPSSITGNHGVAMLPKVPILVVGIFGGPIAKIGRLIKVNELVDGYAVFESQIIIGIDDKFIRSEYGNSKVHDESFALSLVNDLVQEYNKKKPGEALGFISENSQRRGSVRWWWLMRERVLSRILNTVQGFGGPDMKWSFPSKIKLSGDKDNNRLDKERVELVFKLWIRGLTVEEISKEVGYKPALIKALLSGNEAPAMTRKLRDTYREALRERREGLHNNFLTRERTVAPHTPSIPPLANLRKIYDNGQPNPYKKR